MDTSDSQSAQSALKSLDVFRYEPLESSSRLRLLHLFKNAQMQDPIELKLFVPDPEQPLPRYRAMSYAWGPVHEDGSHLSHAIICNGKKHLVTEHLHGALKHIRHCVKMGEPSDPIFLWIDSICIDQANALEKNAQVASIASIYSEAHTLLVRLGEYGEDEKHWLKAMQAALEDTGFMVIFPDDSFYSIIRLAQWTLNLEVQPEPPENDLKLALEKKLPGKGGRMWKWRDTLSSRHLETLTTLFGEQPVETIRDLNVDDFATHNYMPSENPSKRSRIQDQFKSFVKRPWFHRKWVVQEVALTQGKGQDALLGNTFIRFEGGIKDQLSARGVLSAASPLTTLTDRLTLLGFLTLYIETECTVPHDHIYALMGLCSDCEWIKIRYEQDYRDLYQSVAVYYIETGLLSTVLALATAKKSNGNLASWVPDWQAPWDCSRSAMHADAMATVLRTIKEIPMRCKFDGTLILSQENEQINIVAWIIFPCSLDGTHSPSHCSKCILLGTTSKASSENEDPEAPETTKTCGEPAGENAYTIRVGPSNKHERLLAMRRDTAYKKWSKVIEKEFEKYMRPNEVMMFATTSFAFVLSPVSGSSATAPDSAGQYRLEYCCQVDEEGWQTGWYKTRLNQVNCESICIAWQADKGRGPCTFSYSLANHIERQLCIQDWEDLSNACVSHGVSTAASMFAHSCDVDLRSLRKLS